MVYGLRAQSPKYAGDQGSGLRRMGSGITRLLSLNQGSDLLHGLKISYHNIFPHNKVSVHRISWPRYIRNGEMGLRDQNNGKKIGISGSRIYHVTTLGPVA